MSVSSWCLSRVSGFRSQLASAHSRDGKLKPQSDLPGKACPVPASVRPCAVPNTAHFAEKKTRQRIKPRGIPFAGLAKCISLTALQRQNRAGLMSQFFLLACTWGPKERNRGFGECGGYGVNLNMNNHVQVTAWPALR